MKQFDVARWSLWAPAAFAAVVMASLILWLGQGSDKTIAMRVPGTDQAPGSELGSTGNVVLVGKRLQSAGQPGKQPGAWPQFRGPMRDGINRDPVPLSRAWLPSDPRELWGIDVGEGYAGATVLNGQVYLMDYDREKKQDALRCLSLETGQEIWRFAYPVAVKRNHGMSRTVPAATEKIVVAMGPKCHVLCVESATGELQWGVDLVRQYGATVPPWYAGQCPLIDGEAVILAPGGKNALLLALKSQTGEVIWQTPNPRGWKMTHASIMPMEFAGVKMYVYCADKGVVGVSAANGELLWEARDWKISIATVPSPVVLDGGRVFLSGGYNAGSLMLQLKKDGDRFSAETVFRLPPEVFGATQQTPVCYEDHLYGVRPDGKFACLTLEGKTLWTSDSGQQFGLGPFIVADGLIYALNDSGLLRLIEASPEKYTLLGQAQVLKGRESWGPLAVAGGRLLARDLTRLVCLDVARR